MLQREGLLLLELDVMPESKQANTNEMKTVFAWVYRGDGKAQGLVNHNWNVMLLK